MQKETFQSGRRKLPGCETEEPLQSPTLSFYVKLL